LISQRLVKIYLKEGFAKTGLQFCGLMMGDHSKCGINTMFNTGTVVGVSANIFGSGFPRNFIPSFSWGGSAGLITYKTNKAFEVAKVVMSRRNEEFTENDIQILEEINYFFLLFSIPKNFEDLSLIHLHSCLQTVQPYRKIMEQLELH